MRLALAAFALVALSGCVQIAESRVRSALMDAGLSDRDANCMAGRMVDRLTIEQLRKLEALKGDHRTIDQYLDAVRQVGDAEAVAVTASSAVLCTTGLAS
jgi:hypothetical protein